MTDAVEKKRRATYQDVLDAPAHEVAEIVNGELTVMPRGRGGLTASWRPPWEWRSGHRSCKVEVDRAAG